MTDSILHELRECFLEAYDENADGRIEIGEVRKFITNELSMKTFFFLICFQLAEILPTEENFLLLFRKNHPLDSSVDFMRIWKQFDVDCSGYIEADELKQFIKTLLTRHQGTQVTEEKLIEYTDTIVSSVEQIDGNEEEEEQ